MFGGAWVVVMAAVLAGPVSAHGEVPPDADLLADIVVEDIVDAGVVAVGEAGVTVEFVTAQWQVSLTVIEVSDDVEGAVYVDCVEALGFVGPFDVVVAREPVKGAVKSIHAAEEAIGTKFGMDIVTRLIDEITAMAMDDAEHEGQPEAE